MQPIRTSWTPTSEEMSRVFMLLDFAHSQMARFVKIYSQPFKNDEELRFLKDVIEKKLRIKYFQNLRKRLNESNYNYFVSNLLVQHQEKNSIIIQKRKKNDYFYILIRGEVNIVDQAVRPGQPKNDTPVYQVINTLKSGDTFGEVSLMNPKILTTARVVAKTEVFFLVANQETFARTINDSEFMKYEQKFKFFLMHPLFEGIPSQQIKDIVPQVRAIEYSLNQNIYRKGDLHEQMYFVLQGQVMLHSGDPNRPRGRFTLGPGECFGIESTDLEKEGNMRTENAVSKSTDLIVYRILFKRLHCLQNGYHTLLENAIRFIEQKDIIREQLLKSQQIIENFIKKSLLVKQPKNKKKKPAKVPKAKPSLEWWGVTTNMNKSKHYSILKIRQNQECRKPALLEEAVQKSVLQAFRQNCQVPSEFAGEQHIYWTWKNQNESTLKRSQTFNFFKPVLAPKCLKKEETTPAIEKKMPKMLPQIFKQKLVNYARSKEIRCQNLIG